MLYEVESEGGRCPYQITGTFKKDGELKHFYFRARGTLIELNVFKSAIDCENLEKAIHYDEIRWGNSVEAGWVDKDEANHLLSFFILNYLKIPTLK